MRNEDPIAVDAGDAAIVSKAMIRAAEQLDIPDQTLAGVIGIPETTVIQMRLGDAVLSSDAKASECAILFIRIHSLLSSLMGDNGSASNTAPTGKAPKLQRPLPIDVFEIIAVGPKADQLGAA